VVDKIHFQWYLRAVEREVILLYKF